jgi:hypothetical protein
LTPVGNYDGKYVSIIAQIRNFQFPTKWNKWCFHGWQMEELSTEHDRSARNGHSANLKEIKYNRPAW